MWRFSKIVFFIVGFVWIPVVLGKISAWLFHDEELKYAGFWAVVFLLNYLLFPFARKSRMFSKIHAKYVLFAVLYLPFAVVLFLLKLL